MLQINDIISYLDGLIPGCYAESYDNVGFVLGDRNIEVSGILVCLDITEEVISEAINRGCNLVISHHPLVFTPIKKFTEDSYVNRCLAYAIKNNINMYTLHTNLDALGLSYYVASKLNIRNLKTLHPKKNILSRLTTFIPVNYVDKLVDALDIIGAGKVGNYTKCGFRVTGKGGFSCSGLAKPYAGVYGEYNLNDEERLELTFPHHLYSKVINVIKDIHPYDEPVYHIDTLDNELEGIGFGVFGSLLEPMGFDDFTISLKKVLGLKFVRHSKISSKKLIKDIAFCSGSGRDFIKDALSLGNDLFITSDLKYHDFFIPSYNIGLVDIGHYESEVLMKELVYDILNANFNNLLIAKCSTVTNPIMYN